MPVAVTELPTRRQPINPGDAPLTPEQAGALHDNAVAASFRLARDDDQSVNINNQLHSYKAVEDTLVDLGAPRTSLRDPAWGDILQSGNLPNYVNRLWSKVEAARAANPTHFSDVPKTRPEFEVWAARRSGGRDADEATAAKGAWYDRLAGGLGAGLLGMGDPENLIGLVGGGGAKTVAGLASREFLINSNVAAVQSANTAQSREAMGESYGAGEAVTDVLVQGAIGAGLAVGLHAVPKLFAGRKPADLSDAAVAEHFAANVPPDIRTPDEAAALHVINRQSEIDAANPFHDTPDAHDLHAERLRTAIARIMQTGPEGDAAFRAADTGTPAAALRGPRGTVPPIDRDSTIRFVINDLEGGAAVVRYNDADGGTTKFGVAAKHNPGVDVANLSEAQATDIARRKYWFPELDRAAPDTAAVAFDAGYISGPDVGRRILRESGGDPARALDLYRAHLNHIADTVPGKEKYRRGWMNRVDKLARRIGGEEGAGRRDLAVFDDDPMAAQRNADLVAERPLGPEDSFGGEASAYDPMNPGAPQLRRDLFPDEASWRTAQDVQDVEWRGEAIETGPASARSMAQAEATPPAAVRAALPGDVEALLPKLRALIDAREPLRPEILARALDSDTITVRAALAKIAASPDSGLQTLSNGVVRRRPPRSDKPMGVLEFIARNGGILNPRRGDRSVGGWASLRDQGVGRHDLIKGRGLPHYAPGGGHLFRKGGMTIDEIGEALHEAGYFPPAMGRPTEADVLDMLDRSASGEQIVNIHDLGKAMDSATAAEHARDLGYAEHLIDDAIADFGFEVPDAIVTRAVEKHLYEGMDPHEAVVDALNEDLEDLLATARMSSDNPAYDFDPNDPPSFEPRQAGRGDGSGDGYGAAAGGPRPREDTVGGAFEDERQSLDPSPPETAALSQFDDPDGAAAKAVGDSLEHDLKAVLDAGDAINPAIADRQRQEAALKAASPMRGSAKTGVEQEGTMGLSLFDQADAPVFDLGDGRLRSATEIFDEIDADEAAIKAARNCL